MSRPRTPKRFTRRHETVGGGWFVFRRGKSTGRISITTTMPFEHPDEAAALAEAGRLAMKHPGETYQVFAAGTVVRAESAVEAGR